MPRRACNSRRLCLRLSASSLLQVRPEASWGTWFSPVLHIVRGCQALKRDVEPWSLLPRMLRPYHSGPPRIRRRRRVSTPRLKPDSGGLTSQNGHPRPGKSMHVDVWEDEVSKSHRESTKRRLRELGQPLGRVFFSLPQGPRRSSRRVTPCAGIGYRSASWLGIRRGTDTIRP